MSENECELKMVLHLTDQIKERFFVVVVVVLTIKLSLLLSEQRHFLAGDLADAFVNSFRRPLQGNT